MTRPDPEIVRHYLLGLLPEDQAGALEESYFGDDEAFEEILAIDGELAADYAAGALSPEDRARFEARLAADPALSREVGLARGLAELAQRRPARRDGRVARVLRWLWPPATGWGGLAAAGATALVLIVGGAVLLHHPSSAPPAGPPLLAQLTPDGLRSGSRPTALHVDGHRPVRLSLAIEDEPFSRFSVAIRRGPRRVAGLGSTAPSADGLLRVDLAAGALSPGRYEVEVDGLIPGRAPTPVAFYTLDVLP